ncbi:alpha/beta hydrolase [Pseudofrankia sp. BMG5.37]|nr:alpha/beta hydrolase [Pseudofrankia sp. BMG5.37]MDT3442831.1 alpha/beta hydrolase [Pseudofrankia sp. BMG5.37]
MSRPGYGGRSSGRTPHGCTGSRSRLRRGWRRRERDRRDHSHHIRRRPTATDGSPEQEGRQLRFVLVHGGFHGAWCWERLVPELGKRGHAALAVDLPGHGKRVDEDATLAGYRDAVVEVIESGDVLVGHSMGGFVTSLAADATVDLVRHVVYLAAGLPVEGKPMQASGAGSLLGASAIIELTEDGRLQFRSAEAAIDFFFHDCSPQVAQWAYSMLTPQPLSVFAEPISIPRFWEAELPRSLILCRLDHAGGPETAVRETIARLGVDPLWIDTSHSPFLSQPARCAELILEATNRPPIGPLRPR